MYVSTLALRKLPEVGVALAQGGVFPAEEGVLSWGSEATPRWESVARTYAGPNEELLGFNYAPGHSSAPFD